MYLLRGGRYASCVHTGLSCLDINFLLKFLLTKIIFVSMPDGMTTRTVYCTGSPIVSWQNVPAACERKYFAFIKAILHKRNFSLISVATQYKHTTRTFSIFVTNLNNFKDFSSYNIPRIYRNIIVVFSRGTLFQLSTVVTSRFLTSLMHRMSFTKMVPPSMKLLN